MGALKVCDNIYYVGVQDHDLRVFDIIMRTEHGTSYNSYLVKGEGKTALIESVKGAFFDEHLEKLRSALGGGGIDYIVVNHTEPDHSGSLCRLLDIYSEAVVVGTRTALTFLGEIINHPFKSIAVAEGDSIDLGGLTLKFMPLPMLHWPDTMFTYIPDLGALFPCDCFGCHYADDKVYNDQVEGDFYEAYKYYFDNIIGPYKRPFMTNALAAMEGLDINLIGTGHGPVLRENIRHYIDLYTQWCAPDVNEKPAIVIAYVSAYGFTRALADAIRRGIVSAGVENVEMYDLAATSVEDALAAIGRADGFLIGSPTMVGDALPPAWEILTGLSPVVHRGKLAAAFGSYGWSGEATAFLMDRMKQLKLNTPFQPLKIRLNPTEQDLLDAEGYGAAFAACARKPFSDAGGTGTTRDGT